jgi:hypothetical protein
LNFEIRGTPLKTKKKNKATGKYVKPFTALEVKRIKAG